MERNMSFAIGNFQGTGKAQWSARVPASASGHPWWCYRNCYCRFRAQIRSFGFR